jgi:hypothetical protein
MLHRPRLVRAALILFGVVLAPFALETGAQAAGRGAVAGEVAVPAQRAPSQTCDKLQPQLVKGGFTDLQLVFTDADLVADSSGFRLCVFWDRLSSGTSMPSTRSTFARWTSSARSRQR